MEVKYLLDSNIFIQAHRMHYPFDVVPSFWNKLIDLSNKGIIGSIDKVKKELCETNNPDLLSEWCEDILPKDFFANTTTCASAYAEIAIWTGTNTQFTQGAIEEFLTTDLADPWLIAYAKQHKLTIVTHEVSQPLRKNKIKIPEPCNHFNVTFLSPIEMLRALGEKL